MVECGRQGIDKTITLCSKQCQNVMTTEIKVKQNVVVL
jgi:predicted nucleic acid-binding Zn ribbon protein